jgi:hypothetical protein
MTKLIICNKCGWAHFPLTEDEAIEQANSFKEYFDSLTDEKKQQNYGDLEYKVDDMIAHQKKCFRCGNSHTDFHEETEKDKIPLGVTIQGIIKF